MSDPFLGEIRLFGGNFAPLGWAMCQGQQLSIGQNQALFNLIGTTYGGNGVTSFALPDLRGKAPVHQGQGTGLSSRTHGQSGGSEEVTLTAGQMASHRHALVVADKVGEAVDPEGRLWAQSDALIYADASDGQTMASGALSTTGQAQAHDNLMPFLCVSYIIALEGIYPSQD